MARNEKNVEALAALIARVTDLVGMSSDADHPFVLRPVVTPEVARTIAEQIADRGVLVPSAADDDTLADVIALSDDGRGFSFPWVLRDCLERLAKGDPLPEVGYHHPSPDEIREIAERINHPAAEPLPRQ